MFKSLHSKRLFSRSVLAAVLCSMTLAAAPVVAQPGDNDGPDYRVAGVSSDRTAPGVNPVPAEPFLTEELVDLVAPVALYPDDLLAIVLPAAAYPLQIVQAARFLEELKSDDSLQPDEDWDESVVALLNYPEVIDLLNDDLDWTWQLGEAVLNQETEVIEAVEIFRDRAALAGNLKSDEHQVVSNEDGAIEITPVDRAVIYVPYYEPERVVVYQAEPVYHYYPRPYPLYYYPYPVDHYFYSGFFWGITTAFAIGWHSHHLNVHYSNYYSHPYYGHTYYRGNHYYHRRSQHSTRHLQAQSGHHNGDHWRPGRGHGARPINRGPIDEHRGDNHVIAVSGVSRFEGSDTFKPRSGFKGRKVGISSASTTRADKSISDGTLALTRDTRRPARSDRTRQYNSIPKMDRVAQNRQSSGKTKRARLDVEPDRRVVSSKGVIQNNSSSHRINRSAKTKRARLDVEPDRRVVSSKGVIQNNSSSHRINRSAKSQGRISKSVMPSNQHRPVSRSVGNRVVQTSRGNAAAGIRSPGRVTNTRAKSSSRVARPAPQPKQSQRSQHVSRSLASRSASVANKSSSPRKSNRGSSRFNGSRGQNHRGGHIGRQ